MTGSSIPAQASAHLIKDSSVLYDWHVCDDPRGLTLTDKSQLKVTPRAMRGSE